MTYSPDVNGDQHSRDSGSMSMDTLDSLNSITPLILTYNEEANIARTLAALHWARKIIVIDSFSDDATQALCAQNPRVTFVQRKFDNHAAQWNFGLEQCPKQGWTLALDADHIVSQDYVSELHTLFSGQASLSDVNIDEVDGFRNGFVYFQNGAALRGSLYPPLIALFRTSKGRYIQEGHTQRLELNGNIANLISKNHHDDRKPFARWLSAQKRYAALDATKLANTPISQLRWTDRARLLPFISPLLVLAYTGLVKGLVLNGWAGIMYIFQRVTAECLLHTARIKNWLRR